ncbi:hypothetical protein HOF78_02060 [Candidatus Woesearchaeota archaeon]|jgi:tRNA(Ser,Leu) C12 N-acetylase TAN1|nr:hypothetical protein [Candidatus Woesearchaeota archaeon]MBT6044686.1 hypothetical protein [Candidatus Woesearchaeota archaeon]
MTFIGTTVIGLEDAAIKETDGKLSSEGRVSFEKLPKSPLTLNTIYELITSFQFKDLDDIKERIKKEKITLEGTYKCLCKRKGEQSFNSMIIEHEIGKIIDQNNKDLEYSRENPETIIYIDIFNKNCNVGILKERNLSKRTYRFHLNNQTTPTLVAACLIKHFNIKKEETLLCINCKDGVIPIEATLQNIKVTSQDSNPNNIRNAEINAKLAKKEINLQLKNIDQIEGKHDYIITQIIFSKDKKGPHRKINDIFQLAKNNLKKKLAIITNHPEDIKIFCPKEIKLNEEKQIQHGGLKLTLQIFSL